MWPWLAVFVVWSFLIGAAEAAILPFLGFRPAALPAQRAYSANAEQPEQD
jgi:hypothetical protein